MIVTEVDLSYSIKLIAHCADSQYRGSLYDQSGFGHRNLATSCRKSDPLRHNTDYAMLGGGGEHTHTHTHTGAAGMHTVKTRWWAGGGQNTNHEITRKKSESLFTCHTAVSYTHLTLPTSSYV